ncbi:MAG: hypothetical protein SOX40_08230 [Bacteroidaceae bacterium]|nr:hypothetical protein [Bacteroidaceae bacterium]
MDNSPIVSLKVAILPDIESLVKEKRRLIQLSLRRLHPLTIPVAGRVKRGLKGQKGIPPMVYYTIIYNIGNNFRLQEAFLQPLLGWSSLNIFRPKNLLFLLANGQEKGGIAKTEDRIHTYKICRQVADGIFSKETSILC